MHAFVSRFFQPSAQSYFLFGPRGTGKSTWLQQYYPQALLINLLKPEVLRQFQVHPEHLEDLVRGSDKQVIIIDEIQQVPALLAVVHSLIEEKKGWQFILTGSSARKLKRAGVDLLAGRAVIRNLHPFMAAELGVEFSLDTALERGLLPVVLGSVSAIDTLQSYVALYLEEEVKAEGFVRNITNFSRFLEVMSFSHGAILNLCNIARECAISRKMVESYLSIIEDLLICFLVPVFEVRAQRQLVSHPKFYYFDAGVFKTLRHTGVLDVATEINGAALEGLVAAHLRAWIDYQTETCALYYWRTRHGVEVDFILYGKTSFYAIEVKNAATVQTKDLSGLRAFAQDYPTCTPILLYRGVSTLKKDGVWCLPVEEFLREMRPDAPLPFVS